MTYLCKKSFKKMCKIFIFLFIFLKFVFCEVSSDFLNEPISNSIIFGERRNHILFALGKSANESTFENLMTGFLKLENQAQNNLTDTYYDIALSFGGTFNKNFKKRDKLYDSYGTSWCSEDEKCFEASRVENMEQVVTDFVMFNETCPSRSYKKFILIISDQCLPFLNRQLDDFQKCSSEYRKIILMLHTENDVIECKKQIGSPKYIELYSSELTSNEYKTFLDMNVLYQATWAKSIFNILVVVDKIYEKALTDMLEPQINYAEYDLCNDGPMVAYLQFYDGPIQFIANMTAPVNFANSTFITFNYRTLWERKKLENSNCNFVNTFLTTIKDMPLSDDQYQYNLLVLSDPFPKCLKKDLLWNNTKRHFEIVVLGVKQPEDDYSKFISFSNKSLNHLSYYTASNEGISRFWGDTSICRTYMPAKLITEKPQLIPTTTVPNDTKPDDNKFWIIIGGITVAVLIIIGVFIFMFFKLRHDKNIDLAMQWVTKDEKPQTLSSFIAKAYPEISIDESNVFINFDEILGQGSTCTVYQAKTNPSTANEKIYAIKIPLQYDNSHFEEVMHELNIVKRLGPHSSICSPIFCTSHREIPCIIFEKMDTSLLFIVRSLFETKVMAFPPKKLFMQILWQISNALEFIASKGIIHRDVAARNILFSSPNIAKISDFGLWCECASDSQMYFSTFRKKLPFKWLSIEAMKDKIFSEKSDVWSFGIVMYEMWSGGKIPYSDKEANELIEYLLKGNRLETPDKMPNEISEIMKSCWEIKKEDRPNFYDLKTKIGNLLDNERIEKYNKME